MSHTVTDLEASSEYDVYFVAQDAQAPPNLQSSPTLVMVDTTRTSCWCLAFNLARSRFLCWHTLYKPHSAQFPATPSAPPDTSAPSFQSQFPRVADGSITDTGATFEARLSEPGKVYVVVFANPSQYPTASEVKAGTGKSAATPLRSFQVRVCAACRPPPVDCR